MMTGLLAALVVEWILDKALEYERTRPEVHCDLLVPQSSWQGAEVLITEQDFSLHEHQLQNLFAKY